MSAKSFQSIVSELDRIESYSPTVPMSWQEYHGIIRELWQRSQLLEKIVEKTMRLNVKNEQNVEIVKFTRGWVIRGRKRTVWFYNFIQKEWTLSYNDDDSPNEYFIDDLFKAFEIAEEAPNI